MKKASFFVIGVLTALFCLQASNGKRPPASSSRPPAVSAPASAQLDADYGKIPLQFIANQGQMDARVSYYVQGRDKTIYFSAEGLTFVLSESRKPAAEGPEGRGSSGEDSRIRHNMPGTEERPDTSPSARWVVKLDFVDANKDARPVALERSGATISYFKGKPEEWKAGIAAASKVIYRDLWPGIDLVYSGTFNRMKYEFIVHPGADPSLIKLAYRGAENVVLTDKGQLGVKTPIGGFEDDNPVAYQEAGGERTTVPVRYALDHGGKLGHTAVVAGSPHVYGFKVGEYDRSRTLILDPAVLVYCGYIGGTGSESGNGPVVDGFGNAYVTGYTTSADFPVKVGPDTGYNDDGSYGDAFVAKVNADGTALVYCGYIGGSDFDYGLGIAVDGSGNAYVTGFTYSNESSFPVTVGPDTTKNDVGYYRDAFIAKVNGDGTALVYCGYIGGSASDGGVGVAVDVSGAAYIAGYTASTEATFPKTVGPGLTYGGGLADGFVAKVVPDGTSLAYCGYIGGSGSDFCNKIAVDSAGNAYLAGETSSTEATFPETVGPGLTYGGGSQDAFVAKVNPAGSALVYCGYIGGSGYDRAYGIALDNAGNAYVTGYTASTEATFPKTVGPGLVYRGGAYDAFVAKISADGTALDYCGYIGGSGEDRGYGIAVDGSGNAYVAGFTASTETTFPVKLGPDLTYNGGSYDAFVAMINASGTALAYCGYIGGSGLEYGNGLALDLSRNVYITGITTSTEGTFPVKSGPDLMFNGDSDVFVAKVSYSMHADFNGDGQEDILWRYYGEGGYNRVWFLGNTGGAGLSLAAVDPQIPAGQAANRFAGIRSVTRTATSPRALGMGPDRKQKAPLRIPLNLMGDINRRHVGLATVSDPRLAGGRFEITSQMNVSDPRLVSLALDREMATDETGKTAATPALLGGADVMPVGDLNWQIVGTGDFNNDMHVDILWRNGSTGFNVVWYMNGTQWIGSAELLPVSDLSWKIVGTGDFNKDSHVDILWRNSSSGFNVVWYMNGMEWIGSAVLLGVSDPTWQIVGTGDFNKDGNVDILWRYNGAGGYNVVWYMNGANWAGSAELISVADTSWQIMGTGDYNNDGNVDILWRYNGAGGYNVIWYMNGVTWSSSAELLPVADLAWRIVSR